jgi:hypothetical protein
MALGLPLPPDPQVVDLETLRSELSNAVSEILENLPRMAYSGRSMGEAPGVRQDVNDKGSRIPDF